MKLRATGVFALCFALLLAFSGGVELDNDDSNDIGDGGTIIDNELDTGITVEEKKTEEGAAAQSNTAATTTSTGEKIDKKGDVKFGKIRNLWRKIQKWRDETDGDIVLDAPYYPVGEDNDAQEAPWLASVDVKKRVLGYQSRFMFSSGHVLSICKTSQLTDKCQNLALSPSSAILELDDHGGERFVFTVSGRSVGRRGAASQNPKEKKIERWTVDAKTGDKREAWMALIRDIINAPVGSSNVQENIERSRIASTKEKKTEEGAAAQSNTAATTTSTGGKIDKKGDVKFGKIRSLWRKIQKWRDETDGDIVLDAPYYPVGEDNDAQEAPWLASVDVKKRVLGYQSRFMFSSGHVLSICKTSQLTDKCQNLALSPSSAILELDDHGGERSVFTVSGRSVGRRGAASQNPKEKKIERWTVDAKTGDKREAWMALIRDIINAPAGSSNVQENIERSRIASTKEGDHDGNDPQYLWWGDGLYYGPAFRGDKLGPDEYPLHPGQYLSNVSPPPQQQEETEAEEQQLQDAPVHAVNLYVSFVGALMLRSGPVPPDVFAATWSDDDEDTNMPIWMHKAECSNDREKLIRAQDTMLSTAAGTSGADSNGDDVEGKIRVGKATDEWPTPQTLAMRNGRMRLGGDPNCQMALTPAPRGSWRRFLPWSARWRAIRDSALQITNEGRLAIVSPAGEMLLTVDLNDSFGEYIRVSQE